MRTTPREVSYFSKLKSTFVLSEIQKAVLIGTLLGDGSLNLRGKYHRLHIKHSIKQKFFVDYKREIFSNITNMSARIFYQKVNNKEYGFCEFVTLTHPEFTKFHRTFYLNNKKVVPDNINELLVNPLSVTVWFMDDGAAEYAGLSLQTHSFELNEVEKLRDCLQKNFSIKAKIRLNKGRYVIYIPKVYLNRFIDLVSNYILKEFNYKLLPYQIRKKETP